MSEGLKALKSFKSFTQDEDYIIENKTWKKILIDNELKEKYDTIENELKALEIIKNKGVFVHLLQQSQNVKGYNSLMIIAFKKMAERDYKGVVEKFCLTQQEFDLLKEVLNYGK